MGTSQEVGVLHAEAIAGVKWRGEGRGQREGARPQESVWRETDPVLAVAGLWGPGSGWEATGTAWFWGLIFWGLWEKPSN